MKRPEKQAWILDNLGVPSVAVGIIVAFFLTLLLSGSFEAALWLALGGFLIWGSIAFGLAYVVLNASFDMLARNRRSHLLNSPVGVRIHLYEEAEASYLKYQQLEAQRRAEQAKQQKAAAEARQKEEWIRRQKLADYWEALEPIRFERELGRIYRQLGYDVQFTPRSGDHGVDIIVRKEGKTTVVQSKRQKSPAGGENSSRVAGFNGSS